MKNTFFESATVPHKNYSIVKDTPVWGDSTFVLEKRQLRKDLLQGSNIWTGSVTSIIPSYLSPVLTEESETSIYHAQRWSAEQTAWSYFLNWVTRHFLQRWVMRGSSALKLIYIDRYVIALHGATSYRICRSILVSELHLKKDIELLERV